MTERQWAGWGGLAGALTGLAVAGGVALALEGDFGAVALLFAIVVGLPGLTGLGAILALDAGAVLSVHRRGRPSS